MLNDNETKKETTYDNQLMLLLMQCINKASRQQEIQGVLKPVNLQVAGTLPVDKLVRVNEAKFYVQTRVSEHKSREFSCATFPPFPNSKAQTKSTDYKERQVDRKYHKVQSFHNLRKFP